MKKLLIIGCGSIGKRHLALFKKYYNFICVVDINKHRLLNVKKKFKVQKIYTNINQALRENLFETAIIATPPNSHLYFAKICSKNMINIFIEKPLGMNVTGWKKISDICKKNKLINYVAYCCRYLPYSIKLKKLLKSKKFIGKVLSANLRYGQYLPDWHKWEKYYNFYMSKKSMGGGALLDESHGIDLIRYLFGEVEEVFAMVDKISKLKIDSDDHAYLTLKMKNKSIIHLNFDLVSRIPRANLEICGEKGNAYWDKINNVLSYHIKEKNINKKINYKKSEAIKMYEIQAKEFVSVVRSKKRNIKRDFVTILDAIKTQQIIDKSFESSLKKKVIKLNA